MLESKIINRAQLKPETAKTDRGQPDVPRQFASRRGLDQYSDVYTYIFKIMVPFGSLV